MALQRARLPLALGGWAFFIAENAVLSENRGWIMEQLGEDGYYYLYGACSTAASLGILYGYRSLRLEHRALTAVPSSSVGIHGLRMGLAGGIMSVGLVLASQVFPKLQIPLWYSSSTGLTVRCPFDFSKQSSSSSSNSPEVVVTGLDRVSRHSSLWALALTTAGNAALQPTVPLTLWMLGPTAVAILGGAHTDARFRRGIGGHLDPLYEAQTSHLPFVAMLQQGTFTEWVKDDLKPLNAAFAASAACLWVFVSRGRGPRVRLAR